MVDPDPTLEGGAGAPVEEETPRVADATEDTADDRRVAAMLTEPIDHERLADAVERQEPADAADTLESLEEDAAGVLEQMEDEAAAHALAEMQMPLAVSVVEDLVLEDPGYAGRLIELMAPDDAADLLQALPQHQQARLLAAMEREPADELVQLIAYDRESAGGMMTTDILALHGDATVEEAIQTIREEETAEDAYLALVTDRHDHLIGTLPLRRLLFAKPQQKIEELMDRDAEAIRPELDREEVARVFDRYDLSILPVVSDDGRLLGVVTVDDVIDIIREEQTEDVQRSVGASPGEAVYSRVADKIRGRFPWLGASLGMMCGSAAVVLAGEDMIQEAPVLAWLLPVTAAVVGNGGQQSMMVTLRGIVLGEIRPGRVWPLLSREVIVGVLNGILLGIGLFLIVLLLANIIDSANWRIGMIAGIGMAVSMTCATLCGTGIPLLMRRFGIDPALASSIILIMITDAVSFCTVLALTYFLFGVN